MALKGSEKRKIRAMIHRDRVKPDAYVGKSGITENLIKAVEDALSSKEFAKIKFVDYKDERKEVAREIARLTRSEIVQEIGNVVVFYREHEDEEKRKLLS